MAQRVFYRLADGIRLEPLGNTWATYSAASGDTVLLNTEAAAILELLEDGPKDAAYVAAALAASTATDLVEMNEKLRFAWDQLLSAGLVQHA
ncbi:MAG: HPr-rel-A system PqqD family peptide chaperone [Rudaea sp.]